MNRLQAELQRLYISHDAVFWAQAAGLVLYGLINALALAGRGLVRAARAAAPSQLVGFRGASLRPG